MSYNEELFANLNNTIVSVSDSLKLLNSLSPDESERLRHNILMLNYLFIDSLWNNMRKGDEE